MMLKYKTVIGFLLMGLGAVLIKEYMLSFVFFAIAYAIFFSRESENELKNKLIVAIVAGFILTILILIFISSLPPT